MRVVVAGNCQARPVSKYLKIMCPEIELLPEIIVHLSRPDLAVAHQQILDSADVILAQSVQDGYSVEHLTSNNLRSQYGDKLITWPNLFFTGNCIDIVYITTSDNRRLSGPLDVYHNRLLYETWQDGVPVEEATTEVRTRYARESDVLQASIRASLDELFRRDAQTDVQIASFVSSNWQRQRLFFTFNHPSSILLLELTRQLAAVANIPVELDLAEYFEPEPLNRIVPATLPEAVDSLGLTYPAVESSKGIDCQITEAKESRPATRLYSWQDLVTCFYTAYERQNLTDVTMRYTPKYST